MTAGANLTEIHPAEADDLPDIRRLFKEYQESLGVSLDFQDFDAELAGLPGDYVPPDGRLLIARAGATATGCIALRRLDETSCEMKRLYVRPAHRASGLGRQLAERIISEAREIGYDRMCLDTMPSMAKAQRLYESLGFRDIEPYRFNPVPGTRYLALKL
jgi:ribosomal protein S18 acetylase RimI-like enzyme